MRCIQRTILASFSLPLIICCSQGFAAEHGLTRDELHGLLQERDAAIIELQHTVRDLVMRLEAVEQSIEPARPVPAPPSQVADNDAAGAATRQDVTRLVVDEQAAQRALERTLIQGGALLLPTWRMQLDPSFTYSLNQTDFPTFVLDDDVLLLGTSDVERTAFNANLAVRVGLPFDSQLELGFPYQWVDEEIRTLVQGVPFGQTSERNGKGFGSVQIGLAKTFLRERGWRPDIVGRITWDTGSGHRIDNGVFIGGFESVGGSLTLIKRKDPLVFLGSASYRTFMSEGGIDPGDQFAFSFGTALAVSPSSSIFATIANQFLAETAAGNQEIDGSDITSITFNLGASTIISRGVLLNLTTGIGISENAPDYSFGLSASMQTDALRNFLNR